VLERESNQDSKYYRSRVGIAKMKNNQAAIKWCLAEGKRMKEVGSPLRITTRTVAFHKYRIMQKLHAESDARLVQYAVKHHLIAG
jgi:DNA-binding NarL/FixJ family response regulator